jgi:hypothetical protein
MSCADRHLFGPIHPNTRQRKCLQCGICVDPNETFEEIIVQGNMEIYPSGLFSQWTHDRIRVFLELSETDILLHNWSDPGHMYVFRQAR